MFFKLGFQRVSRRKICIIQGNILLKYKYTFEMVIVEKQLRIEISNRICQNDSVFVAADVSNMSSIE